MAGSDEPHQGLDALQDRLVVAAARHPLLVVVLALGLTVAVAVPVARLGSGSWAEAARFGMVAAIAAGLAAFWGYPKSAAGVLRNRMHAERERRTTTRGLEVTVEVRGITMFAFRSGSYGAFSGMAGPNPALEPPTERFPDADRARFDVVVRSAGSEPLAGRTFDSWRRALEARDRLVDGLERDGIGAADPSRIQTVLDLV
jgi:hypothetical protein